ncbi:MAG: TolC family protein [Phycisphaerales bacterium]|nr:TolC family protein [Phycisphaerales bacterium]
MRSPEEPNGTMGQFKISWVLSVGATAAVALISVGCGQLTRQRIDPLADATSGHPAPVLWELPDPLTDNVVVSEVGQSPGDRLQEPFYLDPDNIIRLLFEKSPVIIASRERMIAARYGLEEFRANLSRAEPYVRADAIIGDFPERAGGARIESGTVTAGMRKETFDGSVYEADAGWRGTRTRYDEVAKGADDTVRGQAGTVHGRMEIPFVGSRARTDRIISAAYQESTARAAKLRYLTLFQDYAAYLLRYYRYTLRQLGSLRIYKARIEDLESLLSDTRLPEEDYQRVQNALNAEVMAMQTQHRNYRRYILIILQCLGLRPGETYFLVEEPLDRPVRFLEQARTPEGIQQMLEQAYANTPMFQVYRNTIQDAELKRTQAIIGKYDVTAAAAGSYHGYGDEDFDDRLDGGQAEFSLAVRRNDPRVQDASQSKAEAEIRQHGHLIAQQYRTIQRKIAEKAHLLVMHHEARPAALENIRQAQAEYEYRKNVYLSGDSKAFTIDDVLNAGNALRDAQGNLIVNIHTSSDCEDELFIVMGEIYRLVGLGMDELQGRPDPAREAASQ